MAIWDLFSKREARRRNQGKEDVFQYDELPERLRAQVAHVWNDAIGYYQQAEYLGPPVTYPPNGWWETIFSVTTREKGVFALVKRRSDPRQQCLEYLMTAGTEDALDLIEVAFTLVDREVRALDWNARQHYRLCDPDAAIAELNGRFRENGVGYEFAGGEIVRVDSRLLHAEVVKPALQLLHGAGKPFTGPLEEFLSAHARHRKGEQKEAVADALKAFESVMKAICTIRRWPFDPQKDTAQKLIDNVFSNGLVPAYLQNQFTSLRAVLESGVPTARNKTSGHGQGPVPTELPGHFAAYVLHMTASNIVYLIESHKAMR